MEKFARALAARTEAQLLHLLDRHGETAAYAAEAVSLLSKALAGLRASAAGYVFPGPDAEIAFFRETKPWFTSRLLYHNGLYNLIVEAPPGGGGALRKYYKAERRKIRAFFQDNAGFCRYWRSGARFLDDRYFRTGGFDVGISADAFSLLAGDRFTAPQDLTLARMMAFERLDAFIGARLAYAHAAALATPKKIRWTGSKVALVELVYALHAGGVLDGGAAGLKEIAAVFENAFSISLGQFNRTFLEIRERKADRTKFLHALADALRTRMDQADEK